MVRFCRFQKETTEAKATVVSFWSERRPLRPSGAKLFEHERQAGRSFTFYPSFAALVVRFPLSPQQKGARAVCPCPFCGARDVHCALRAQSSSSTNDKRGNVLLSTRVLRRLWFASRSRRNKKGQGLFALVPFVERETSIAPFGRKALRARTTSGKEFYFLPEFCGACGSLLSVPKRDHRGKAAVVSFWSERRESNPRESAWEADAIPLGDSRISPATVIYYSAFPKNMQSK